MSIGSAGALAIWERSANLHPIDAALAAVAVARPDAAPEELARLPLGERDAVLLESRRELLGDMLEVGFTCPGCGTEMEAAVSCSRLLERADGAPAEWMLDVATYRVRVRPVNSRDAAVAATADDPLEARMELLRRCVVDARRGRRRVPVERLPSSVTGAISASLSDKDPLAEVMLELDCPSCGSSTDQVLDVARSVVEELAAHGVRLLGEVDLLARTYGWTEAQILNLSSARRAGYVALAGA